MTTDIPTASGWQSAKVLAHERRVCRLTIAGAVRDANGILTDGPTAPGQFEGKRVTYP
jgi:hypothetical protein